LAEFLTLSVFLFEATGAGTCCLSEDLAEIGASLPAIRLFGMRQAPLLETRGGIVSGKSFND
jgi:hypothetical protein